MAKQTLVKGHRRRTKSGKEIYVHAHKRVVDPKWNGITINPVKYQTTARGRKNIKQDKQRLALKPGIRISKDGSTYWETRDNRSDLNKKKRL